MLINRHLGIVLFLVIFPAISFAGQFKCTRVTDGDTIIVSGNGQKITIRLVGIDAPETSNKKHEPGQPSKGLDLEPYWKAEKVAREAGRQMWSLADKYNSPRE